MTDTELTLIDKLGAVAVPLSEVCDTYFGMSFRAAMVAASLNKLPVPTFRLRDSKKAPTMVHVRDLAQHIDATHADATRHWERSQV